MYTNVYAGNIERNQETIEISFILIFLLKSNGTEFLPQSQTF